jgi:RND family efflux transporter MFP subunit
MMSKIIKFLLLAVLLAFVGCGKKEVAKEVEKKSIPVIVANGEVMDFEDNISVEGSVEAKDVAMVTPRISGTITELFVNEGDAVEKDKTKLFAVDAIKTEQAMILAKQELAVAKCAVNEKEALKEQAEAVLNKAEIDYKRQKKLYDEKQVGTLDTIEKLESGMLQAKASVKHADTLIQLSKEQVSQAAAALEIAKKNLSDTVVKAPISGVVSETFYYVGDMGTTGKAVFKIESVNKLEASFYIPSQYYSDINAGTTKLMIFSNEKQEGDYVLSYKAPSIDNMLRVFEVKADLVNSELVAPGSLISGVIQLGKSKGIGVPTKAIIKKQTGDVVFVADGEVAKLVPIKTGLEFNGWTEVVDESIKTGDLVIVEGQFLLNDDTGINVRK